MWGQYGAKAGAKPGREKPCFGELRGLRERRRRELMLDWGPRRRRAQPGNGVKRISLLSEFWCLRVHCLVTCTGPPNASASQSGSRVVAQPELALRLRPGLDKLRRESEGLRAGRRTSPRRRRSLHMPSLEVQRGHRNLRPQSGVRGLQGKGRGSARQLQQGKRNGKQGRSRRRGREWGMEGETLAGSRA